MNDRIFDALGDPTRRRLLEHLGTAGPGSASEIADHMPVSRQAVAKQLGLLEEAGLVERHRRGRSVEFHLVAGTFDEIGRWTDRVSREWAERLDRLDADR